MSSAWMRMPGETWSNTAASFFGMWLLMMAAMMLPSLVPMLWRFRQAVGMRSEARKAGLTTIVGAGYFFVWAVIGLAVFPMGVALTTVETRLPALARVVPIAVGVVVLFAGVLQFTEWKAHHLACCREAARHGRMLPADTATAWRHGVQLGLHCSYCSSGLMAMLLVLGMMNVRAMAIVTAAITAERLLPAGARVAKSIGAAIVFAAFLLIARAVVG